MREETLTLWRRADARKGWCEALRDCLGAVAVAREIETCGEVASWQDRIDRCDEIKAACEAEVAKELDGDPDAWLRDAFGK